MMHCYQEQFFEASADAVPDAVAVDDGGDVTTYGALEERANRIAHRLAELGCGANDRVAVFTNKSADTYAALLGVLKAGGCWVPFSNAYPAARLQHLTETLRPRAVICDAANLQAAAALREAVASPFPLLVLGGEGGGLPGTVLGEAEIAAAATGRPAKAARTPEDLAYIIFTSGSTGTPKGVMVSHRSTSWFLGCCREFFAIEAGSRFAHFSELTFDPSVFDLFHGWQCGGAIVPFNRRKYRINPALFLEEAGVNVLFTVPSVVASVRESGRLRDPVLDSLRHLLLTGEALPPALVADWYAAHPESRVYNMYGTTETAIVSHWYAIPSDYDAAEPLPVGRPLPGTRVTLMDGDTVVEGDGTGESVVSGTQLSTGYWANPYQTERSFVRDPFDPDVPQVAYRTGDILRRHGDDLYFYVGRADAQVKLRGHRVELGEIENVIMQSAAVLEAAVVALDPKGGDSPDRVVAFVVPVPKESVDGLEAFVVERLPSYMVPSRIVRLDKDLPRNQNGKVDRNALRGMAAGALD